MTTYKVGDPIQKSKWINLNANRVPGRSSLTMIEPGLPKTSNTDSSLDLTPHERYGGEGIPARLWAFRRGTPNAAMSCRLPASAGVTEGT